MIETTTGIIMDIIMFFMAGCIGYIIGRRMWKK